MRAGPRRATPVAAPPQDKTTTPTVLPRSRLTAPTCPRACSAAARSARRRPRARVSPRPCARPQPTPLPLKSSHPTPPHRPRRESRPTTAASGRDAINGRPRTSLSRPPTSTAPPPLHGYKRPPPAPLLHTQASPATAASPPQCQRRRHTPLAAPPPARVAPLPRSTPSRGELGNRFPTYLSPFPPPLRPSPRPRAAGIGAAGALGRLPCSAG